MNYKDLILEIKNKNNEVIILNMREDGIEIIVENDTSLLRAVRENKESHNKNVLSVLKDVAQSIDGSLLEKYNYTGNHNLKMSCEKVDGMATDLITSFYSVDNIKNVTAKIEIDSDIIPISINNTIWKLKEGNVSEESIARIMEGAKVLLCGIFIEPDNILFKIVFKDSKGAIVIGLSMEDSQNLTIIDGILAVYDIIAASVFIDGLHDQIKANIEKRPNCEEIYNLLCGKKGLVH